MSLLQSLVGDSVVSWEIRQDWIHFATEAGAGIQIFNHAELKLAPDYFTDRVIRSVAISDDSVEIRIGASSYIHILMREEHWSTPEAFHGVLADGTLIGQQAGQ